MSILSMLFNSYPMLTQSMPDGLTAPVTDGSGRYMEAGVALKCLVYPIDADPATLHLVGLRLNSGGQGVSAPPAAPSPVQTLLFDVDNATTEEAALPAVTQEASKIEPLETPTLTPLEPLEAPSAGDQNPSFSDVAAPDPAHDEIPAVSMEPYLDRAYAKLEELPWVESLTPADEEGLSPLADAYAQIKNKRLVNFVVRLGNPTTSNTGIYSESRMGGAYQCYGAVVIGSDHPDSSLMPDIATGPSLRARLFELEDETPVFFHVMHRVEVVNAIRSTELFSSFARSVAAEHQDRVNNRAAAAREKENDELGAILSDPKMVKALFARLMENAEGN